MQYITNTILQETYVEQLNLSFYNLHLLFGLNMSLWNILFLPALSSFSFANSSTPNYIGAIERRGGWREQALFPNNTLLPKLPAVICLLHDHRK